MNNRRLFLILTLLIFVSDILFVVINYHSSQRALDLSLNRNGANLQHEYNLALSLVYENMLQLATYVAEQKQVKALFLAGKKAVFREGGGDGGEAAAAARKALYDYVSPSWSRLMGQYDARQLQFHLGPGSLSFLRAHQPQRFGDRMDEIRHIIVDTHEQREARTGFEVGRVSAGLRGVTPVWSDASQGHRELIGVLEVGTSFQTLLEKIYHQTGVEMMVLLRHDLVHSTMWSESISKQVVKLSSNSSCYVEAVSKPLVTEIVKTCDQLEPYRTQLRTFVLGRNDKEYAVTHFPLYDYRGTVEEGRGQAGMVIMLTDITEEVTAHWKQLKVNLIYALMGFIVIEALLYLGIRFGSRKLNSLIERQTEEINQLKEYYKARSERDSLTGLYNHRCFNERLEQEMNRSGRSHAPLCLLMLDLDNFKSINDRFGHVVGDAVLEGIASLIDEIVRSSDFAGRYGGEEFTLALVDTQLDDAVTTARRLIRRVASFDCPDLLGQQVTASGGVAMWQEGEGLSGFIRRADEALYRAKQKGKNRVECIEEALIASHKEA
jgi:diguanylate cyclase (GGDEF)-like protein